jgi:hypothetical protein
MPKNTMFFEMPISLYEKCPASKMNVKPKSSTKIRPNGQLGSLAFSASESYCENEIIMPCRTLFF